MGDSLIEKWKPKFLETVQHHERTDALKRASLDGALKLWTASLTEVTVSTCEAMGWQAAGKGHRLDLLPQAQHEYLSIDVMAFRACDGRWPLPVAAIELENVMRTDRIAYSLWKVLCVHAPLRLVFCYRNTTNDVAQLVRSLKDDVIGSLSIEERTALKGDTVIVVGSREEATTFPYGFFKWYCLETNTGAFKQF